MGIEGALSSGEDMPSPFDQDVFIPVSATRGDGTWMSALALLPSQEP